MGKFDWLKPKPPIPDHALEVRVNPVVHTRIDVLPNGDIWWVDSNGYVRIVYPKGKELNFIVNAEGYRKHEFYYNFLAPNAELPINLIPIEQPEPEPVPLPTGPIKGDWLTCRHPDGELLYPSVFPVADRALKNRILEALFHNHYTDTFVDVAYSARNNDSVFNHPGWNYLTSDPQPFIDACKELQKNGIRTYAMVGYQKDIAPPFGVFKTQLENFLIHTGEYLNGVVAGAEAEEYWKFDEIGEVLKISARYTNGILGYHGGRSSWGPDGGQSTEWTPGGRQTSWWRWLKEEIPGRELYLFYQYHHTIKLPNGGFSTPDDHVIEDTQVLLVPERLGNLGIKFIAAEYNYLTPEHMKRLGNLAIEHGAHGFINGGFTQ